MYSARLAISAGIDSDFGVKVDFLYSLERKNVIGTIQFDIFSSFVSSQVLPSHLFTCKHFSGASAYIFLKAISYLGLEKCPKFKGEKY